MDIRNEDIYKSIRMISAAADISEAELARRVGDSPQAFNNKMKRGKIQGDLDYIKKIAAAAGFRFEWSFVEDGE